MTTKSKSNWQAVRILQDMGDSRVKIEVQLGYPVAPSPSDDLWRCAYRVTGLGSRKTQYGAGCDALQAIMSAFDGLALLLRSSGRKFKWIDLEGETGVRRQIPIFLGAEFADEIETHIDKQIESFVKAKQKAAKKSMTRASKP